MTRLSLGKTVGEIEPCLKSNFTRMTKQSRSNNQTKPKSKFGRIIRIDGHPVDVISETSLNPDIRCHKYSGILRVIYSYSKTERKTEFYADIQDLPAKRFSGGV